MPCEKYTYTPQKEVYKLSQEIDGLTDMLCRTCKAMDNLGVPLSRDVQIWWDNHKKIDLERKERKRIAKEKALEKEKALSKLSKKERKLLGY